MTLHIREIEKLAEKNVRKWTVAQHARDRLAKGKVEENVGPYIVVSRETGAGGSAIARLVGQKLLWDVLDKEIVDYLATQYGTPRSLVEFVDEKPISWIEEVFSTWVEGRGFTSSTYVHRLNHLLLLAAHHGNVVIVGRERPVYLASAPRPLDSHFGPFGFPRQKGSHAAWSGCKGGPQDCGKLRPPA